MSTELIINASLPETRIALLENGEIQELLIERASGKGIVGNIYKGRVTRVLPGMQAAFVDIGLEKAAFLYVDDVFVHSEVWEQEEAATEERRSGSRREEGEASASEDSSAESGDAPASGSDAAAAGGSVEAAADPAGADAELDSAQDDEDLAMNEDLDDDSDDEGPVGMTAEGGDGESGGDAPEGTVAPAGASAPSEGAGQAGEGDGQGGDGDARRRRRRGRRGGRNRRRGRDGEQAAGSTEAGATETAATEGHEALSEHLDDEGYVDSDRSELGAQDQADGEGSSRPQASTSGRSGPVPVSAGTNAQGSRPEFRENRDRHRRIKAKPAAPRSQSRGQVNIQDLLKEGQEVLVQVAKDPIATKGARLTCHISLPGRHLVCMPTIDHVGV